MSWPSASIGDLVDAGLADIQTGPFGTQLRASDYVEDGTPVINVRNIGFGGLKPEKLEFVTEETAERLSSHLLQPRDIVFGRKGAVERHLYVSDEQEHWMQGSDCIRLRLLHESVVPRFVSYFFLTESHQKWMLVQAGNKATMASLNHDIIKRITLRLPSRPVQAAVVDILSAYDNLIENNRRRMTLLEEAARQLYREWFVRLRFPGYEHTRITNGVPNGWEQRTLSRCARFLSGGTPSKSRNDYWDGNIPWVSSGELTAMRIHQTTLNLSEEGAEQGSRVVPAETILAVVRGMSLAKEFRIGLAARSLAFNQDIKAICAFSDCDPLFLFHSLDAQRDQIRDKTGEASHGTKKLDSAVLAETPVLVPSPLLQRLYRDQARCMHDQWDNLEQQNSRLRAARDLLLPRLMRGEMAV